MARSMRWKISHFKCAFRHRFRLENLKFRFELSSKFFAQSPAVSQYDCPVSKPYHKPDRESYARELQAESAYRDQICLIESTRYCLINSVNLSNLMRLLIGWLARHRWLNNKKFGGQLAQCASDKRAHGQACGREDAWLRRYWVIRKRNFSTFGLD